MGDFNDLRSLIRWAASHGAGFIGLNPLHALSPSDPARSSPYSASSRHFLNVLYIAVPLVPEFAQCAAVQERLADSSIGRRLGELRDREWVDYRGVADLKFEILSMLYRDFRDRHLATGSGRARDFQAFMATGGKLLQTHARFDALDRYFRAALGAASGWLSWPAEFRDVDGRAARRFADTHPQEVEFYAYLQWLAHEQLSRRAGVGARAGHAHRPVRRLCGGRQSLRIRDLGGSGQLPHGRRNRRTAGPSGAQGPGLGHTAAGSFEHAGAKAAWLRPIDPQQHAPLRRSAPGSCDVAVPPVVGCIGILARRRGIRSLSPAAIAHGIGARERAQRLPGGRRRSGRGAR